MTSDKTTLTEARANMPWGAKSRRKFGWWLLGGLSGIAAIVGVDSLLSDDLDFSVTTQTGYQGAQGVDTQLPIMSIQSRNDEKVVVRRILVNNDDKCLPTFKGPMEMALGDTFSGIYFCNPVKVSIETDAGTANYSMSK
jgi:hypothetical protein